MQKELFYIHDVFAPIRVNFAPFMLGHMQAIITAKKGHIFVRGVITSIARIIGLEA